MNQSSQLSPGTATNRPSSLLLVLALLAVYIIWGTTYLANRFGLLGMKPFILSTFRYALVAILLLAFAGIRRLSFPSWKNARVLAISGLLMLVGGSGLVVTGEQYINSGATAVIIATEPLLFLLLDRRNRKTYSAGTLTGIALGFAGIFLFSRFTSTGGDALTGASSGLDVLKGTLLVLISTVFWVAGTLYSRNQTASTASPVTNAAVQHIAGAIACVLIAALRGDWKGFHPAQVTAAAWGGLAYLVVMGSLVAFMAFMWLVKVQPPAVVSTHTYVNPIVAVLAGWMLANETIGLLQLAALVMVLLGVLLVQSRVRLKFFLGRRQPRCEPGS